MMRNNLFLRRLLIYTEEGKIAYDEEYHKGINIIRGDNSSGKSTITHFIFFVLGGSFSDFVPEAKKCSRVIAEVEMNGAVFTIKRYIEKDEHDIVNAKAAIYIFWGNLNESLNQFENKGWQKFGYNAMDNRKSFSNVFFDNLGLPIVKGDSNITMHQILRLLYIDQESPTSSLFYYEHFDSQLTRETVADLLLGVYNEELYDNKKRLIYAEKEFENVKSELKATLQFFPDKHLLDTRHLRTIIENKEKEVHDIEERIIQIRHDAEEVKYDADEKLNFQKINNVSIQQRYLVVKIENEINDLKADIIDSEFFIETLSNKISALRNSIKTRDFLGNLPLEYCPECLTKIRTNSDKMICSLCKEPIDESFGVVQARRMELETGFQINESQKILDSNKRKLIELESKYEAEILKLQELQRQVNAALKDIKTFGQEKLDQLYVSKGFVEGEILQFKSFIENAELYGKLEERKNNLEKEISSLKGYIFNTEKQQTQLKNEINLKIKEEGLYLLNNDLDRQEEFKNANEFYIDYANNIAFLSNKYAKYSASSNFYLKVTARFAIFLASLSINRMRYPRFIFADNMEDKGIEPKRAQNLQKIIIDRVLNYSPEQYQIIYTTSYITEELNNSPYVVGEYYKKENPSLKNISK